MIDARNYIAAEKLKDGTSVVIRAIRDEDKTGVLKAFKNLDPESVYTRYFAYKKVLTDAELAKIADVDFDHVVALVATTPIENGEQLIGGGRYVSGAAGADRGVSLHDRR